MASIDPRPEDFSELLARIPPRQPVVMLNMLNFAEYANYADDSEIVSGREAYSRYAAQAVKFVQEVGGRVIWRGAALSPLIAPVGEDWDEIFLVRYPAVENFMEMLLNPEYQAITRHRRAALADSRLIALREEALTGGG